jgi:hypothetical protein
LITVSNSSASVGNITVYTPGTFRVLQPGVSDVIGYQAAPGTPPEDVSWSIGLGGFSENPTIVDSGDFGECDDTTPPSSSSTTPDSTSTVPTTSAPDTTAPDTSAPDTTAPSTSIPPNTPGLVPGVGAGATVSPGEVVTVGATGFQPGEQVGVTLFSTPRSLGTVIADDTGAVGVTFSVLASDGAGLHHVVFSGPSGTVSVPITVVLAAQAEELPTTR